MVEDGSNISSSRVASTRWGSDNDMLCCGHGGDQKNEYQTEGGRAKVVWHEIRLAIVLDKYLNDSSRLGLYAKVVAEKFY